MQCLPGVSRQPLYGGSGADIAKAAMIAGISAGAGSGLAGETLRDAVISGAISGAATGSVTTIMDGGCLFENMAVGAATGVASSAVGYGIGKAIGVVAEHYKRQKGEGGLGQAAPLPDTEAVDTDQTDETTEQTDDVPQLTNPTGNDIRNDSAGQGTYGSPRRGGRLHAGLDIQGDAGTNVAAPTSGRIIRDPIAPDQAIQIVDDNRNITTRLVHINPDNTLIGTNIQEGAVIGTVRDMNVRNMLNHVHVEIYEHGTTRVDPTPYFFPDE